MYNRLNQPDRGLSLLEVARKIFDRLGLVADEYSGKDWYGSSKTGSVRESTGISFNRHSRVVPGTNTLWGRSTAIWDRFLMS